MTPKLTYFNSKGLAEFIRLLLKYGDIEFEDFRIEHDQWPEVKPTIPFGQLPTFEENGKIAWQSLAIGRYIAKKVGLIGDTNWENLEIDAIVDTISDLRQKLSPIFYEKDEAKKAALLKANVEETIPYYLDRFEKIVNDNNGYLALKRLTWADFYLVITLDILKLGYGEEVLSKYPNVLGIRAKVENVPNIKNWIKNRPVTQY